MSQVGAIIISENVNTQAMIDLFKNEKKVIIGKETVTEDGVHYIPINKNG